MSDSIKVADDLYMVPWSDGNGQLRREIWLDGEGRVERYELSYLNRDILAEDQGRVLGYGLDKGSLVRHHMGTVTPFNFSSIEEIEERFALEWDLLPKQNEPVVSATVSLESGTSHDEYTETKDMKLTITKGSAADFFGRGKEIAGKLDRGERIEPEKIVIFGDRHDLCYSQVPRR
jgi:hypothetical protein